MKRKTLSLLITSLALSATSVTWAQEENYRLAFSKNDDIEIFIDGVTADTWCVSQPALRVVAGPKGTLDGFAELLPRLGAVFNQQCPEAESVTWSFWDNKGTLIAEGDSASRSLWALNTTEKEEVEEVTVATTDEAVTTTETVASESAVTSEESEPAITLAVREEETKVEVEKAEDSELVEESTAVVATADVVDPEPEQLKQEIESTESEVELSAKESLEESLEEVSEVAKEVIDPRAAALKLATLADFDVAGSEDFPTATLDKLLSEFDELENQDGCKIRSKFNFSHTLEYLKLKTDEGFTCNDNGYLNGRGEYSIQLLDGQNLATFNPGIIQDGMIFSNDDQTQKNAYLFAKDRISFARKYGFSDNWMIWVPIGSNEELSTHYFLSADLIRYTSLTHWRTRDTIYALTDRVDDFKDSEKLRTHVESAIQHVTQFEGLIPHSVEILFVDDYNLGLVKDNIQGQLYNAYISNDRFFNKGITFEQSRSRNLLIQREQEAQRERERKEQEAQRERERKEREAKRAEAKRQQEHLEFFQNFEKRGGGLEQLFTTLIYTPIGGSANRSYFFRANDIAAYEDLIEGKKESFKGVIRVVGRKDDDSLIDYPFEMRLENQQLEDGWYYINGTQWLDPQQLDAHDLPLTYLQTKSANAISACEEVACQELKDPLKATRRKASDPEWTPEKAKEIIENAPTGFW